MIIQNRFYQILQEGPTNLEVQPGCILGRNPVFPSTSPLKPAGWQLSQADWSAIAQATATWPEVASKYGSYESSMRPPWGLQVFVIHSIFFLWFGQFLCAGLMAWWRGGQDESNGHLAMNIWPMGPVGPMGPMGLRSNPEIENKHVCLNMVHPKFFTIFPIQSPIYCLFRPSRDGLGRTYIVELYEFMATPSFTWLPRAHLAIFGSKICWGLNSE